MSSLQSPAQLSKKTGDSPRESVIPPSTPEPRGYLFLPQSMKRGRFLVWLRRTHAWIGLWGAALGLLFGTSGILLNHRNEMKIPLASQHETRQILAPPVASLESAEDLRGMATRKIQTSGRQVAYPEEAGRARTLGWGSNNAA